MAIKGDEPISAANVAAALGVSTTTDGTAQKPISAENLKACLESMNTDNLEDMSWSELSALSKQVNSGNVDMFRKRFKNLTGHLDKEINLSEALGGFWSYDSNSKSSTTLHAVLIDVCKDVDVNGNPCLFTFMLRGRCYAEMIKIIEPYDNHYQCMSIRDDINDGGRYWTRFPQEFRDSLRTVPRKYYDVTNYRNPKINTINDKMTIPSIAELGISVDGNKYDNPDGEKYEWLAAHRGLVIGGFGCWTRTQDFVYNSGTSDNFYFYYIKSSRYTDMDSSKNTNFDDCADLGTLESDSGASSRYVLPIFCI